MNIGLLISTVRLENRGIGGHYYSLLALADSLNKEHNVIIINIGLKKSFVLEHSGWKINNIISKIPFPLHTYKSLKKVIKENEIDILHAFDVQSFFWARVTGFVNKIPYLLTKCGGPNPEGYYPVSKTFILFSKENYNYFHSHHKFNDSNIHLIPNRVNNFQINKKRIESLQKKKDLTKYSHVLLRISRIGVSYDLSNSQIINLLLRLRKDKLNVCLLLIGTIENEQLPEKYLEMDENIFILSDNSYTLNSKELLGIADCVMGTGRSFMEASSIGTVMLAPNRNSAYPVLVDQTNFDVISDTNFSERYQSSIFMDEISYSKIKELLLCDERKRKYGFYIKSQFDKFFNINAVLKDYDEIYTTIKPASDECFVDIIKNYWNYAKYEIKHVLSCLKK